MKYFSKLLAIMFGSAALFTSCNKIDITEAAENLPFYKEGFSPFLSSDVSTVSPVLADSNRNVVTFS